MCVLVHACMCVYMCVWVCGWAHRLKFCCQLCFLYFILGCRGWGVHFKDLDYSHGGGECGHFKDLDYSHHLF